jgi:hypothetical protein
MFEPATFTEGQDDRLAPAAMTTLTFNSDLCSWTYDTYIFDMVLTRRVSVQQVLDSMHPAAHEYVLAVTRANMADVAGRMLSGDAVATAQIVGMRDLRDELAQIEQKLDTDMPAITAHRAA